MKTRISAVAAALLLATAASAEESNFNLHLEPAAGFGLNRFIAMSGAALKVDTTLLGIPYLTPQLELFGVGAANNTYLSSGSAFGGGIGLRLRLLNDEQGYRFSPGGISGNWWGNLWVDAHVTYSHGGLGVGMDAAVGYEFSVIDGLQVGPFAKFMLLGARNPTLHFGLSFTVLTPSHVEFFSDGDKDGLAGAKDKCPDKAGPESNQGCPLPDKDNDGVDDASDKCPDVAGARENAGCPLDKDKDGIEDSKDKCPAQPGPAATGGCPDQDSDGVLDSADKCPTKAGSAAMAGCPDTDGDGLSDADDKCPAQAGTAANGGCPDQDGDGVLDAVDQCPTVPGPAATNGCPDGDGDGVADVFDNCPTEKGEASNQGCPAAKKQLVVITKEALKILDKVQFASGKATILPKSFALLDQVASVLKSQAQIKLVQVEGHTDNVGKSEANTKLSQARADAVVDYLSKKGVEKARLKPVGFGQEKPVQSNDTAEGKEANRRVEFNIVAQ